MKQVQVIRVVVASPSDVQPERNCLEEVASELNRTIAKNRSLYVEIARWEIDAYPGFHVEGPQGLIDTILRIEECDLLIGIFWKRFGTPIADAKSGTEHEFHKAYEAWKLYKRPQIMIYFNQKPYYPKSKAETDQWGQVLDFKHLFPQEGLWWTYSGKVQFEKLVRQHLTHFILNMPEETKFLDSSIPTAAASSRSSPSIDEQIVQWLAPFRTQASKEQYRRHVTAFRRVLHQNGLDLDSEDENRIKSLLEEWAMESFDKRKTAAATFNQRLAVVKSFYRFARKQGYMRNNPLEFVDSRKEERENTPQPLTLDALMKVINAIDRSNLMGKRDFALLAVLLTTGKFVSEVAELRFSDILREKNSVSLLFHRARDGKMTREKLTIGVATALDDYIVAAYPDGFAADSPLWVSFDRIHRGGPIAEASIHKICTKYLNTTRGLTTRYIYAKNKKGAIAKEIDKLFQDSVI